MNFVKCYTVSGLVKTCLAVPSIGYGTGFMPTYELCKLYFRDFADALTYAQRYCSDFPWAVIAFDGTVVARSAYGESENGL